MHLHGASTALRSHASGRTLAAESPPATGSCGMAWRLLHLARRLRVADGALPAAPFAASRRPLHRPLPPRAAADESASGTLPDGAAEAPSSNLEEPSVAAAVAADSAAASSSEQPSGHADGASSPKLPPATSAAAATRPPVTNGRPTSPALTRPVRRLPLSDPGGFRRGPTAQGDGLSRPATSSISTRSNGVGSSPNAAPEPPRPPPRRRSPLAIMVVGRPADSAAAGPEGSPGGARSGGGGYLGAASPSRPFPPRSGSPSGSATPRRPRRPTLPIARSPGGGAQQQRRGTGDGAVVAAAVQATVPPTPPQQQQERAPWDDHPIDLLDFRNSSDAAAAAATDGSGAAGGSVAPAVGPPRARGPRSLLITPPSRSGAAPPPPPPWARQAVEAAAAAARRRQQQQQGETGPSKGAGQANGQVPPEHWLDHWSIEHHPGGFWAQLMGVGLHLPPAPGDAVTGASPEMMPKELVDGDTAAAATAADDDGGVGGFDWAPVLSTLAPPSVDLSKLADDSSFASAVVGDVEDLQGEPLRLLWLAAHQPGGAGAPALVFAWECGLQQAPAGWEPGAAAASDTIGTGDAAKQEMMTDQQRSTEQEGSDSTQSKDPGQSKQQQQRRRWPEMPARLGEGPDAVCYRATPPAELPRRPQLRVEGLTFSSGGSSFGSSSSSFISSSSSGDGETSPAEAAAATEPYTTAAEGEAAAAADAKVASGSGDGEWHTYVFAVRGGFSLVGPHETTFPNVLADLSDGRVCHNARSLSDAAAFAAEPLEGAVRAHAANLARCALQRPRGAPVLPPEWCLSLLRARWGEAALRRFGVGLGTLLAMG